MNAQVDLVMTPSSSSVAVGDELTVTLVVEAGSTDLNSIEAYLDYDPAFVTVTSVTYEASDELPVQLTDPEDYEEQEEGQINAVSTRFNTSVNGTFDYLSINLTAIAAGSTTIDISLDAGPPRRVSEISNGNGDALLRNTTEASITITGAATTPVVTIGGDANKVVMEDGTLTVPISVSDADGDDLTVMVSTVSDEPQLLNTSNAGTSVDPYPTTADGFLTVTDESNSPGSYSANLNFSPTFGDGGGANGDGDGQYTITVQVMDGENTVSEPFALTVTDVAQTLSTTAVTRIEAESFDNQGPPNPNQSGNNGIGVEINPAPGVINTAFTHAGDFAEYEIDVPQEGTYQFTFEVGKNQGGTAFMDISADGGATLGTIAVDVTGGWQTYESRIVDVELAAGPQTLRFDWRGSSFLFNTDYFDVEFAEDAAPTVSITSPDDGDTFVEGDDVTVLIAATDDVAVTEVELFDGTTSLGTDDTAPYEFTISGATGSYSLTATASDGNATTTSAVVNINSIVANTAPVVTIDAPVDGASLTRGTNVTLTGSVTDAENNAQAEDIEWTSDDTQIAFTPTNGTGASITARLITPGPQIISAFVADAGGLNDRDEITVNVSTPGVTLTSPGGNGTVRGTDVQMNWTATDVLFDLEEHFHLYVVPPSGIIDYDQRISTRMARFPTSFRLSAADGIILGENTVAIRVANQFHEEFLTDPNDPDSYVQDIVTFNVVADELPGNCDNTLYRVNVGGPTVASIDGTPVDWSGDTGATGEATSSPFLISHNGSTYSGSSGGAHPGPIDVSHPSVPASAPASIFNTERFNGTTGANMKWEFPIESGTEVEVTLLFAELFGGVSKPGERLFDVVIEGLVRDGFNDIDQIAVAGPKGAFSRTTTVTVNDGTLDIEFNVGVQSPALKGIQICGINGPADITPPVITLLGDNPLNLTEGDSYTDPGATASDDTDGDISGDIVVGGDQVDANMAGEYVVTYNVTDAAGNAATEVTRTVNVAEAVDDTPPVITLLGDNPLNLTVGDSYADPGATATDDTDGDLSGDIVVGGDPVDPNAAGTYVVTYNVSDVADNAATEVMRTVVVSDEDFACAKVSIASGGSLAQSSTFGGGVMIANNSAGSLTITSVAFDLSTAIYPNMVFDPVGTAGDNTAKCVQVVSESGGDSSTGLTIPGNAGTGDDPDCTVPFSEEVEPGSNGYSVMTLEFTDFEPGEGINLAIDIDPTSIKGFASAGNAGAISGFELIGSTVTVTFSDGSAVTSELYRTQPSSVTASENFFYVGAETAAPGLTVLGATGASDVAGFTDATVTAEAQTVRISGSPGDAVSLLVLESTIEDLGPGVTPGPFEANKLQFVQEFDATIGSAGTVDVAVSLDDNASGEIYHLVAVKNRTASDACGNGTTNTSEVWRLKVDPVAGDPSVLVEITPGTGLNASTFGGSSSFQITNQSSGNLKVTGVSIDLSTGILPDMVFDPTGSGGDATAQCFTAGSTAAAVGLVDPADDCVNPFSGERNGGFDVIKTDFTDFDPGENFSFSVDVDPNSIKDVPGAGGAGSVSGYEMIGATLTVTFNDGSAITGSIYEDGSLGGGQAVLNGALPSAPSISVGGLGAEATVGELSQTVTVSGTPGNNVSLLVMDSRLFIQSGEPPFNVQDETYYANEAMSGKDVYAAVIGSNGTVDIEITLLETAGSGDTPDGGLNQLIAVTSDGAYAVDQPVSATSNVITLLYDPAPAPDTDGDGVPDADDNCVAIANADQADLDGDLEGDVCDDDIDGDGVPQR